jgi:hypothetical protein
VWAILYFRQIMNMVITEEIIAEIIGISIGRGGGPGIA